MTTIIALKTTSGVFLGSDTQITVGDLRMPINFSKIIKKDNLLIGLSGSISVVQNILDIAVDSIYESKSESLSGSLITPEELATSISHSLFSILRDGGELESGSYTICSKKKIVYVGHSGAVIKMDKFISEGSGSPFALSVLKEGYKRDLNDIESFKLLISALKIAHYYDINTNNYFEAYQIDNTGQIIKYSPRKFNKKKR